MCVCLRNDWDERHFIFQAEILNHFRFPIPISLQVKFNCYLSARKPRNMHKTKKCNVWLKCSDYVTSCGRIKAKQNRNVYVYINDWYYLNKLLNYNITSKLRYHILSIPIHAGLATGIKHDQTSKFRLHQVHMGSLHVHSRRDGPHYNILHSTSQFYD